jgi:hypothetical protein
MMMTNDIVDFGRRGSAESLMGTKSGVVEEAEIDSLFEVPDRE